MLIHCPQLKKTIQHEGKKRIFDVLLDEGFPIASSCRGNGICHWCKIQVSSGQENLTGLSKFEEKATLENNERLSCQAKAKGDITITTSYW
jgi:2Fe-2S ferredoxin